MVMLQAFTLMMVLAMVLAMDLEMVQAVALAARRTYEIFIIH